MKFGLISTDLVVRFLVTVLAGTALIGALALGVAGRIPGSLTVTIANAVPSGPSSIEGNSDALVPRRTDLPYVAAVANTSAAVPQPQNTVLSNMDESSGYTLEQLRGFKGDPGAPGVQGPPGYSIGSVQSNQATTGAGSGTLAGVTYLSAKEFNTETLNTSGTATLANLHVSGTTTFSGSVGITTLGVTGLSVSGNVGIGTSTPTNQLDVNGLDQPVLVATVPAGIDVQQGWAEKEHVAIQGDYLYVTNATAQSLQVYDISGGGIPVRIASVSTDAYLGKIAIKGHYAYVISNGCYYRFPILVFDISNPAHPVQLPNPSYPTNNCAVDMVIQGNYAYVASVLGNGTINIVDISDPYSMKFTEAFNPTGNTFNLMLEGNLLVATNGSLDYGWGTIGFDISDPSPEVGGYGIPSIIGESFRLYETFEGTMEGKYLYGTNNHNWLSTSFTVVDLTSPTSSTSIFLHEGYEYNSKVIKAGKRIYMASQLESGENLLRVFDVSVPLSPVLLSTTTIGGGYWNTVTGMAIRGRYLYIKDASPTVNDISNIYVYDIGGAYIQQLTTGSITTSAFSADGLGVFLSDVDIRGGLNIARPLQVVGGFGVIASGTGNDNFQALKFDVEGLSFFSSTSDNLFRLVASRSSTFNNFQIANGNNTPLVTFGYTGNVGIGTANLTERLEIVGNASISGNLTIGGNCSDAPGGAGCTADYAEAYQRDITDPMTARDLLAINPQTGLITRASNEKAALIGVFSSAPGALIGQRSSSIQLGVGTKVMQSLDPDEVPVALIGRVPVKVSLEHGPIAIGDRLSVSSVPGVAAKAHTAGMTVGVAMEDLTTIASGSTATILIYVNVSYWAPTIQSEFSALASADPSIPIDHTSFPLLSDLFASLLKIFDRTLNIVFQDGLIKAVKGVFTSVQSTQGVTTYDEDTGLPFCMKVKNTQLISVPGECGAPVPPTPAPEEIAPTPTPQPENLESSPASGSAEGSVGEQQTMPSFE